MQLAQLKMLLDDSNVEWISLHIDFLPYGRQDKPVSNDTTFGLWPFSSLLNHLNFSEVIIMDPHSKIAMGAIWKSTAVYPHGPLGLAIRATTSNLLCYPDSGAVTKYTKVYDFPPGYIYGRKVRDQATGYISSYKLVGDCKDKRVLIVDDICDGGKTFELLAKDLYNAGAEEVNLFVTHGLFSKGLIPLKLAGIKRIFTNKGQAIIMHDSGVGFRKIETSPYNNPYWDDRR
jgi:ribose-phosphate pyrophosphokinase